MIKNSILITGGAGFIGSNLVQEFIEKTDYVIINLDKLTYAGNLDSLSSVLNNKRHIFIHGSIGDKKLVKQILTTYKPWSVINLAAETHVDRSIDGPAVFIQTNIVEVSQLLEIVRDYWMSLECNARKYFRFLHVSTDEVFGSLGDEGLFTEESKYAPNSPYAASKAASDHLVRAYNRTYGLPTLLTNCSNNYGPCQFPEKLIPLIILKAIDKKPLPVYGDGKNVRDWIYVRDHCNALMTVLNSGIPGEAYNIGGSNEKTNIEVVTKICDILDKMCPRSDKASYKQQISFVTDRPGHDYRYAIDHQKVSRLGWKPEETFETGLRKTVQWYLDNRQWIERVQDGTYQGQRLGLA